MKLTWYGHSAFRVEFGDTALLIDPFLSGNPTWDGGYEGPAEGISHVLLTHGHDDHIGDTVDICRKTGATLVSNFEIAGHLQSLGVEKINPGNHGGTLDCGDFTVTFVNALHSSSREHEGRLLYLGNPVGLIVTPKEGPVLYHLGDTGIFGDMALINELYRPEIGIVPIGDRFTMGAREAAHACRNFFTFRTVIPSHFGTFGMLDPGPEKFLTAMGDAAGTVTLPERGVPFEV